MPFVLKLSELTFTLGTSFLSASAGFLNSSLRQVKYVINETTITTNNATK